MINLTNIAFQYSNSDFRFEVDKLAFQSGSKTAIIGPSGVGKTTLLNLISGIYIPQKGSVVVKEKDVSSMTDAERRTFRLTNIGFVFQDFKLLDYLKVLDNILLPFRINKVLTLKNLVRNRAKEIASMLNIEDKLSKYPDKLSHGERQRVAICRALLNDPPIILADEPTGNLDPENKKKIMSILFDYVQDRGSSLITVTHDHELLKGFDRIVDFKELYKY
ncbi:MAG: ABC transporter ATP-binding protein [Bacteroidetes bacterium]|nr:MAG: ABC transporter ATP-binding protein [Bacteroidota bacterium]